MSARAGKVAQWLRADTALIEDPTLTPAPKLGSKRGP